MCNELAYVVFLTLEMLLQNLKSFTQFAVFHISVFPYCCTHIVWHILKQSYIYKWTFKRKVKIGPNFTDCLWRLSIVFLQLNFSSKTENKLNKFLSRSFYTFFWNNLVQNGKKIYIKFQIHLLLCLWWLYVISSSYADTQLK